MIEKNRIARRITPATSLLAVTGWDQVKITSIGDLVSAILPIVYGIIGIFLFALLLYGGFTWLTSAGDSEKIRKATDTMFNAVIGVAIVVFAFVATKIVGGIFGIHLI